MHCSLRIPDLREGDDSPLRTSSRRSAPATCHTRQLPTPRIPPCGLNGTSQTRLPPCAEGSSQLSSHACHAAHAAAAQPYNVDVAIYNSVVLATSSKISRMSANTAFALCRSGGSATGSRRPLRPSKSDGDPPNANEGRCQKGLAPRVEKLKQSNPNPPAHNAYATTPQPANPVRHAAIHSSMIPSQTTCRLVGQTRCASPLA